MAVTRRRVIGWAAASAVLSACRPLASTRDAGDDLDVLAARLVYGGQPPDGISPIDLPVYDPAGAEPLPVTSFTPGSVAPEDDDVVDAFVGPDGKPRAYPRSVTVWHEVVNDIQAGRPVSLTYCPLTGSAVLFSGVLSDGGETSFGTSGELLDSNLVMYDRATRSMWPQLLGVAVRGARRGDRLRELPGLVTTTYGRWRSRYPTTLYLTALTGRLRPYGTSPYGDYDRSDRIVFPVGHRDERFPPKTLFYGIHHRGGSVAVSKARALADRVVRLDVAGDPLVVIADAELEAVRAYDRRLGSTVVEIRQEGGRFVDQTGSQWSVAGVAVSGRHTTERLEPVSVIEAYWFAWAAFHPGTAVVA